MSQTSDKSNYFSDLQEFETMGSSVYQLLTKYPLIGGLSIIESKYFDVL